MSKFKGAGAILHSPLVQKGFRFPEVELIDQDDSYLLEIEIKIKNGKHDVYFQLHDLLNDFPVEVILQRPGLIQVIIDTIGTYLTNIEDSGMIQLILYILDFVNILLLLFLLITDNKYVIFNIVDIFSLHLSPMDSLVYLVDVFQKCIAVSQAYIDGSLCATYPSFAKTLHQQLNMEVDRETENNNSDKIDTVASNTV